MSAPNSQWAAPMPGSAQDSDGSPSASSPKATETVAKLAKLSPLEYDQQREAAAKALGIRTSTLDAEVKRINGTDAEADSIFDNVEPWPQAVNGAALLDEIAGTVRRFIVCSREASSGAALWAVMTWFMDVVQVAPIAAITAPEKRCGKSLLLAVLRRLSRRPLAASSITPAALYRSIEAWEPTLLIDEADTFLPENEELRGIINSGHTRDSAYVIRTVGDDHTPTKFSTWGAKAIAGIGSLADTIKDRSIELELRRKMPGESVDRLRYVEAGTFEALASKLARFADDHRDEVRRARPDIPTSLNDRAQDSWEPLLAIADVCGGHWPKLARDAALLLSGQTDATLTGGAELLADIKAVFERTDKDKITSRSLIEALCADDEAPWATWNKGRPISPRQLSRKLDAYGIQSKNVRIDLTVSKGFERSQFEDAFSRYLSAPPEKSATPLQNGTFHRQNAVAHSGDVAATPCDTATSVFIGENAKCSGVADLGQVAKRSRYEL